MIRIAIADDHPLFREGLRKALSVGSEMCLVEEASNGEEALTACARSKPDILLLDLTMPLRNGFSVLRELPRVSPGTRVLILTVHNERDFEERALRYGALGFLQKDSSVSTILQAIRAVASGQTWATRAATAHVLDSRSPAEGKTGEEWLTPRDRQFLLMLAQGLKNREMAFKLGLSEKTVTSHLSRLVEKLNVRGRVELALYAHRYARAVSDNSTD